MLLFHILILPLLIAACDVKRTCFTKTQAQNKEIEKVEVKTGVFTCLSQCLKDKRCEGFDNADGDCVLYSSETDNTTSPKNIYLRKTNEKATEKISKDCDDLYRSGVRKSRVYDIQPQNSPVFQAYCDLEDDAGWTVMLRRFDGSLDFGLLWNQYKHGFGNLSHEFWLGNDKLHFLTNQTECTLKVEYEEWDTHKAYFATYTLFNVYNETDLFQLHVSGFGGNGTNALYGHREPNREHDAMYFSTLDRDNDRAGVSCAQRNKGGFWYNRCYGALPTGLYRASSNCMEKYWPTCTRKQIWKIKPNAL